MDLSKKIEITRRDFLMVEDYFNDWFNDWHFFALRGGGIFSFINGEVYIVELLDGNILNIDDVNSYKLTKEPYFKSRNDVYEKFRSFYFRLPPVK